MSDYVQRTMIVAAQDAPLAQGLALGLAGEQGQGMFTTGLSPTGAEPATHFISSGPIFPEFAALLGDAQGTFDASGGQVPLASIEGLYARADFTEDDPYVAMARLELQLLQEVSQ